MNPTTLITIPTADDDVVVSVREVTDTGYRFEVAMVIQPGDRAVRMFRSGYQSTARAFAEELAAGVEPGVV